MQTCLNADQVRGFHENGYMILRGLFDQEEIGYLISAWEEGTGIRSRARSVDDGEGGHTEIALWNEPSQDVFGAAARCERMVKSAQTLLADEVYHYHSKINFKRPKSGGTWVWHQDYGYWYNNGCLYPDMLTAAVPLSVMDRENGCLQVVPGSNRMGRIDHGLSGQQTGADPDRVRAILDRVDPVAFEAEPGDVMFFHCNTLHTSAPNSSDRPRNLLLIAYNARHNDPHRDGPHPRYTPLDVLPDTAVREEGRRSASLA